jgi:hypothetical protein
MLVTCPYSSMDLDRRTRQRKEEITEDEDKRTGKMIEAKIGRIP